METKVRTKDLGEEEKKINLDITDIRIQAEFERLLKQGDKAGANAYLVSLGLLPGRAKKEYKKREKEYNANQEKEEELKTARKKTVVSRIMNWVKFWKKEDKVKLSPSLTRYIAKKELEDGFKVL